MIKELGLALILSPFAAVFIVLPFVPPSPEYLAKREEAANQERLVQDQMVSTQVQECLEAKGPWRCYVSLKDADEGSPIKDGDPRVTRFAKLISAEDVLRFCDLPRKVDCANEMFGSGFKAADIQSAVVSLDEVVGANK